MRNNIHTVIFDLDGTLFDTVVLTMTAFKNILPGQGLPIPDEEAVTRATGYPTPEFYYILFPDFGRELVNNIGKLVDDEELRLLPSLGRSLLFDKCHELLASLKERGIRLCIASTGSRDHVFSVLKETGITGFFDTISCEHPDKIGMLREIIGDGNKNGFIMVGDMKKDHEGAAANNILSVGACYGYCKREIADFDLYIDSPLDLLNFLKTEGE